MRGEYKARFTQVINDFATGELARQRRAQTSANMALLAETEKRARRAQRWGPQKFRVQGPGFRV